MKLLKRKTATLLLTVILIAVLFLIPAILLYEHVKTSTIKDLGENAISISSTIATFIEEDIEPYKNLSSTTQYIPGNYDEIYYNKMQKLFQKIKKDTNVDFVYTEKQISSTQIAYILDGEDPNSKLFSPLGSIDRLYSEELKSFNEGIVVSTGLIEDPVWGNYISGFAPIKDNHTGEVIGIVGVDFSLDHFNQMIDNFKTYIFFIFFIIILLTSILVIKLLASLLKSLENDYLTGLHSKYYHDHLLKRTIKVCHLKNKPLSIIMIDIDDFKDINDQFGHLTGDKFLRSVAQIIQANIRDVDTCSRYAGDEFVIILPDATKEIATILGHQILEKVSCYKSPVEGMESIQLSLSMGIAQWDQHIDAETLTDYADQAMYISKSSGKNKITIFNK